ncbi:hypothetical protein [Shewanella sp. Isolate11]|uniref:hypothetical protein n=1 Tax=Shewanella sp. Isolate11 TaxID=2908530 RepID=UPI001EFCC321|nr:hypothetical protein [Shewanella sp. Isolate11]MCG9695719.1 hypothetical protein [Shewanella sp. Isolate11]
MPTLIEQLLAPYRQLNLSAFDNMKLLKGLLAEQQQPCQCFELQRQYEQQSRGYYCIEWQQTWIDCGWSNDYSASFSTMDAPSELQVSQAKEVEVPLLTLQQLSFMCMQYSHFDHC